VCRSWGLGTTIEEGEEGVFAFTRVGVAESWDSSKSWKLLSNRKKGRSWKVKRLGRGADQGNQPTEEKPTVASPNGEVGEQKLSGMCIAVAGQRSMGKLWADS
jgi:hypothetical protein